tara:strand:+ start:9105 stop:9524 length:420 start_codon:yes stop_codon:yes gene_type:complete
MKIFLNTSNIDNPTIEITETKKTTMNFEQYVIFQKQCSSPANLQWIDKLMENPRTDLDNEINNMINTHTRLKCLVNFDRMFKRNGKFGKDVDLIIEPKSNSVKMFPQNEKQLFNANKRINELNIGLNLLFNLRLKTIIK